MAPHSLVMYGAFVTALAPGIIGLNAIWNPRKQLQMLGFTPATLHRSSAETANTQGSSNHIATDGVGAAEAVAQMYGARNITMTLTSLAVLRFGNRDTLGWVMLAGVPLAIIDGFVSRARIGPGSEWGHWMFAPVGAILAAGVWEYY